MNRNCFIVHRTGMRASVVCLVLLQVIHCWPTHAAGWSSAGVCERTQVCLGSVKFPKANTVFTATICGGNLRWDTKNVQFPHALCHHQKELVERACKCLGNLWLLYRTKFSYYLGYAMYSDLLNYKVPGKTLLENWM